VVGSNPVPVTTEIALTEIIAKVFSATTLVLRHRNTVPGLGRPLPVLRSGKRTGIPIPEEWVKARELARMGRSPDY